jgi:hypothetical protein
MAMILFPFLFMYWTILLLTLDFPQPVLTAHTDTTGTFDFMNVSSAPKSPKFAPFASTSEALSPTCSWLRSEYERNA